MQEIEKIAESISRLQRKMRAKLSNELSQGEITIPQYHILEHLNDKGETTMHEVADYLFVTPPAVTGLVDKLVKMQLVQRDFSSSDRRIIIVSLTPKGKTVILKIKNQSNELFFSIFKGFSAQDRKNFLEVTQKMEELL
ncbi:MAG: MarR family transcriptional regulator [Candidatus Omnitrophica bacterium]|nr:MarR family transcriptional regulator [Candidatus Omnitrophota bacterium]MBU1047644.1 MarR family transcriptional regulator [Candidatus Omnitrophota bacterium]MBU1631109.1 MarR family transcriptional regulator [Candidatus Omnitrophota bacterium]MBU1767499.1 MarR family transcriptional regulator [Candidatus Omnitrophota bacterium]MBU1888626.1 MarR family transcriptional regulator [Candidatus Omnitrophota bacterium]